MEKRRKNYFNTPLLSKPLHVQFPLNCKCNWCQAAIANILLCIKMWADAITHTHPMNEEGIKLTLKVLNSVVMSRTHRWWLNVEIYFIPYLEVENLWIQCCWILKCWPLKEYQCPYHALFVLKVHSFLLVWKVVPWRKLCWWRKVSSWRNFQLHFQQLHKIIHINCFIFI